MPAPAHFFQQKMPKKVLPVLSWTLYRAPSPFLITFAKEHLLEGILHSNYSPLGA
jgi:hypothetical protein